MASRLHANEPPLKLEQWLSAAQVQAKQQAAGPVDDEGTIQPGGRFTLRGVAVELDHRCVEHAPRDGLRTDRHDLAARMVDPRIRLGEKVNA